VTARGGKQRIPRPPRVEPGAPPAWAALPPTARRLSLADVRRRLAELPAPVGPEETAPGQREAAVLVPLFEEDGEARLILTKRPETMPSHQGEIAFPGGKRDPDDPSLEAAALREAFEEIGLRPALVEVVAELDSIGTVASLFTITPFVGFVDGRPELLPHPTEVVDVFDVALSELLDPEAFREERWEMWGDLRPIVFFELPGETVWGATARILAGLLAHLTASPGR
jgi:8-oxo-dGTP pyrophosphatase MutT (NUDIX family)